MSLRLARKLRFLFLAGLLASLVLAGCSNPLADDPEDPVESAETAATSTPAPPMPIITPTPVDPTVVASDTPTTEVLERPDTYIVAEGDTLYGIAAQFDVEISALVEANGLSDPNDIWVGQELSIPSLD